jgi:hypothetical protein
VPTTIDAAHTRGRQRSEHPTFAADPRIQAWPRGHESWLHAIRCDPETRVSRMQARYWELATARESPREQFLELMIREELDTDDREYREITGARLRAWLRLAEVDPQAVRTVARSYNAVFARLPGALEFRRAMAVQAVVAQDIRQADGRRLLELVPGIERFVPTTSYHLQPRA